MKKIIIMLLIMTTAFTTGIYAQAAGKIDESKESVVAIVALDASNYIVGAGTGVSVGTNKIATNFHIIEGYYKLKMITCSGKIINLDRVSSFDKKGDIAVIETSRPHGIRPVQFADSLRGVGSDIIVIGYPLEIGPTVSTCNISNKLTNLRYKGSKEIQISNSGNYNSSGNVLLDNEGKFIGMIYASKTEQQQSNYAMLATEVKLYINKKDKYTVKGNVDIPKSGNFRDGTTEEARKVIFSEGTEYDGLYFKKSEGIIHPAVNYNYSLISEDGDYRYYYNDPNGEIMKIYIEQLKHDGWIVDSIAEDSDCISTHMLSKSKGYNIFNLTRYKNNPNTFVLSY